jgi:hypothetical protein
MTSEMKSFLIAQLQQAIDEAVSESGRIAELVDEMKLSGYELCLMLESTISISPSEDFQRDAIPEPRLASKGEMTLTDEDLKFLQELNIAA